MPRIKTFTNGSAVLPADLNNIQDDYEKAFTAYRTLETTWQTLSPGSTDAGTRLITTPELSPGFMGDAVPAFAAFYLDPADYGSSPRAAKLKLGVMLRTNAVAPAANMTFGLYPVATWAGASGAQPTVATVGTVISGSTIAINTPAASTTVTPATTDFNAPTAGYYIFGVVFSAAIAANSWIVYRLRLQARQT